MSERDSTAGPDSAAGQASPPLERVRAQVGRELPGGSWTLEPWRAWLLADCVEDDPADPLPHPVLAWMACVGGMGLTWDELFAWFDATADDGPMFGEHRTTMHRPLAVGTAYRVGGRITSVDRKSGRRAGVFDIIGYELTLHEPVHEELVATCWNSLVLPRRSA